jgi:AcrR family transcriptional regulator
VSRRASRRESERKLRREDVLAAASAVFAAKGFHDAQMSEIATRAEVSLASVYQLFASKEELFQAVIESTAQAVREEVERRVAAVAEPRERLLGLVDALFGCFQQSQDLLRIYARATHGIPWRVRESMGDGTQALFQDFVQWVIERVREARSQGIARQLDAEAVALTLIGAVTHAAAHAVESDDPRALQRLAPRVRAVFARLLEGQP